MAHKFTLNSESLKRRFAVYVVVAKGSENIKLYVGKTGDNRDGCNPIISRCGNHFSYNNIHSQIRNKISDHENREYTYIFDHFDEYYSDQQKRRESVDRINEMERWLNQEVQNNICKMKNIELLNPLSDNTYVLPAERKKRSSFRTDDGYKKITGIIEEMKNVIG